MQGSFHQVALVLFCTISALIDVGYNRHTSQVRAFVEAESNSATGPGKKLPLEWRRSPWVDGQLDPECGLWLGVSKCLGRFWTLPRPLEVSHGERETCVADPEPLARAALRHLPQIAACYLPRCASMRLFGPSCGAAVKLLWGGPQREPRG